MVSGPEDEGGDKYCDVYTHKHPSECIRTWDAGGETLAEAAVNMLF